MHYACYWLGRKEFMIFAAISSHGCCHAPLFSGWGCYTRRCSSGHNWIEFPLYKVEKILTYSKSSLLLQVLSLSNNAIHYLHTHYTIDGYKWILFRKKWGRHGNYQKGSPAGAFNCIQLAGVSLNIFMHKCSRTSNTMISYFLRKEILAKLHLILWGWNHNGNATTCMDDFIPFQCLDFSFYWICKQIRGHLPNTGTYWSWTATTVMSH